MVRNYVVLTKTIRPTQFYTSGSNSGYPIPGQTGVELTTHISNGVDATPKVDIFIQFAGVIRRGLIKINNVSVDRDGIDPKDVIDLILILTGHETNLTPTQRWCKGRSNTEFWGLLNDYRVDNPDWTNRLDGPIPWTIAGAIDTSDATPDNTSEELLPNNIPYPFYFDLEFWKNDESIDLCLWTVEGNSVALRLYGMDSGHLEARRPALFVRYRSYSPEAFKDENTKLTIQPFEDNKELPHLKWGKVNPPTDPTAVIKLYRSVVQFTKPSSATLIATLPISAIEYIDTTATTSGASYFYMVVVETTNHTLDSGTYSNLVSFDNPNISATTFTPGSPYNYSVGQTLSLMAQCNNGDIYAVYVEWGDGSNSWYEVATPGYQQTVSHILSAKISPVTPLKVRIKNAMLV